MTNLKLVGVGASAGGVDALIRLVAGLDPQLQAAVLVVLHQSSAAPTVLPEILSRHCRLEVVPGRDGDPLRAGRVHVAPPGHHLLVEKGHVRLSRGPKENGHRPGIDPLFRSLALEAGPEAVGVVLTGMLDDGAAGLLDIVRHGGAAVVQEPVEAMYDGMPGAALDQVPGAAVRPVAAIGAALGEILDRSPLGGHRPSDQLVYEVGVSRGDNIVADRDPPGEPAGLACPDCDGPLFGVGSGGHGRYRCRVGHAWSSGSLGVAQDDTVERTLYSALRALEDKASLQHRVAEAAASTGQTGVATRARQAADAAHGDADVLRRLLIGDHRYRPDNGTAGRTGGRLRADTDDFGGDRS